jgi:hypothetical protein
MARRPWGGDTAYYEGEDDGGREYLLPAGHVLAEDQDGSPAIYDAGGRHCALTDWYGHPALANGRTVVVLRPANG